MESKIKTLDVVVIIVSLLKVIGLTLYFWGISIPNGKYGELDFNPFYDYNTNLGIILINTINTILWLGILTIGVFWMKKRSINYKFIYLIFCFCGLLAIIRWIEIWYGSTFYYGEIRDKQGLYFPLFSLFLTFYPIWRYKIELINKKQILFKSIASILILLSFIIIYMTKFEAWNLWQSW